MECYTLWSPFASRQTPYSCRLLHVPTLHFLAGTYPQSTLGCALIPCLRGRDSDHVLGSFQPSDSTAAIRLLSSISLMKPSKLSDTSHSNSGLPSFCRGEKSRFTRHKWGDISSQFCSESTFFWSTQLKETEWVEVIYKLLEGYFQSGLQQFRNPYPKNNTHAQVS